MKITDKTIKALKILKDNPRITAKNFSKLMWEDSKMHNRTTRIAWLKGACYLSRLRNRGLVYKYCGGDLIRYFLSKEGEEVIK